MAKVDCTELEKAISDLALSIGAQDGIETFDDVVAEIQKSFPIVSRSEIVTSIVNATGRDVQQTDALRQKLNEIKRTARMEKVTAEKTEQLESFLETGELPAQSKPRKITSETLQQARMTVKNLRKWLKTADPAMRKALQEKLDALNTRIEAGDVVIEEKREGELHETLKALQEQVEIARRQIADEKTLQALQTRIDEFQGHLDAGTLPGVPARPQRGTGPADLLRDIRDDLKKQLAQSEPAQRAKLEKQITALQERIDSGDFAPRHRPAELPQSKELEQMVFDRDRLRRRIRVEAAKLKPRTFWSKVALPFDVARDLLTTGEFSPVLRQGAIFAYGHPIKTVGRIKEMLEAWAYEQASDRLYGEMMAHPEMPGYQRAGGYISAMGADASLSQREEIALSRLFYEAPFIKRFTRAGVVFLNKLRFDTYLSMKESVTGTGELTQVEAEALAQGINEATGRAFKNGLAIAGLERTFFSAQYLTSRFQLLTMRPLWWYGTNRTRQAFAKEYFRALTGLATVYLLGWLAGGEDEWDRRSSDFGKIRFGDIRVDPLFGLSQIIVFGTRLILGETKSTKTGKVTPLRGEERKPLQRDTTDVIASFARSKLHPAFSIPWNILAGEKPTGQPTDFMTEAWDATHPITWEDIYKVAQEEGMGETAALSFVAFFGMGVQQYQDNWEKRK